MSEEKKERLSDETIQCFRDSLLIVQTGKDKDGNSFNNLGTLNQAAWIGEHSGLLLDELTSLRAQVERLEKSQRDFVEGISKNIGACPACAEGIFCGSTTISHVNCVYTRLEECEKALEPFAAVADTYARMDAPHEKKTRDDWNIYTRLEYCRAARKALEGK